MKLKYKIGGVILILVSVFLYGRCGGPSKIIPGPLPTDNVARITVDPSKHHIRIEQPNKKPVDTFLPDRLSTFEVKKNGFVKVSSAQWGLEHHFFFGVQQSNVFRIAAGLDGFYWKKLDLGLGVADKIGNYTPVVFLKASYLVYDNLQLGLTFDNMQYVGGSLTLRI